MNDIYNCFTSSAINLSCAGSGLSTVSVQLPQILAGLRSADPGVPIVGMNYYDPFVVYDMAGMATDANTSLLVVANLNSILAADYGAVGSRMADVFTAFQASTTTLEPYSGYSEPTDLVNLCNWTYSCQGDPHPNDTGHGIIANAFFPLLPTGAIP
jgi:hypothetical protein